MLGSTWSQYDKLRSVSQIHTADADETKVSLVASASAVCIGLIVRVNCEQQNTSIRRVSVRVQLQYSRGFYYVNNQSPDTAGRSLYCDY